MKRGMTLTSLLVAVALSGIIAVFGGRLVVNQMFMAATTELIDKGDAIMQFYVNALQDQATWRCTLFDIDNDTLRKYMFTTLSQGNISASGIGIPLRGPDCDHPEATRLSSGNIWQRQELVRNLILDGSSGKKRGTLLIPSNGKKIGNTILGSSTTGWWQLNLKAIPISPLPPPSRRGDIDLELSMCLNEANYNSAHSGRKQVPRSYRWKCGTSNKTRRLRYSETATNKAGCSTRAIVGVTNRSAGAVSISCSYGLLAIPETAPSAWKLAPNHQLTKQDVSRQGVIPLTQATCRGRKPVVHVSGGNVVCGSGALVEALSGPGDSPLCGTDNGIEKVLCGFTNMGRNRCCTPKGPKGPKGLKGCPALIVTEARYKDRKATRVCKPRRTNTETCPNHGGNYMVSSRPSGC